MDFPHALKERRASRRLSQLELALRAGTTQRHLSFIESGRSVPGREMVIRLALSHILDAHMPYPAIIIDRRSEIVAANAGQRILTEGCAEHLRANAYRLALHPDGMAPRIANFADWAWHVLNNIAAELARSPDELRLMTTITSFANAVDVTISELKLEAFLPADQATSAALTRAAGRSGGG